MAKLKAVLDSLEGIPEAFHELYSKSGDSFVLQIEDHNSHPAVQGLVSTVEKQKRELGQLKPAARSWQELQELAGEEGEALTPQGVHDALQAGGGDKDGDVQQRIAEGLRKGVEAAEAKFNRQLEKITGERDTAMTALRGSTVDAGLDRAIAKVGVVDKYRPAVRAMLKELGPEMVQEDGSFRGVFRKDPDGIPRDVSIDEYVEAWATSDAAAPYMPAKGGGSGAHEPGGGGLPAAGTIDGNDALAWGQNAEKIASGETGVS